VVGLGLQMSGRVWGCEDEPQRPWQAANAGAGARRAGPGREPQMGERELGASRQAEGIATLIERGDQTRVAGQAEDVVDAVRLVPSQQLVTSKAESARSGIATHGQAARFDRQCSMCGSNKARLRASRLPRTYDVPAVDHTPDLRSIARDERNVRSVAEMPARIPC
jgi:hypothetical protein